MMVTKFDRRTQFIPRLGITIPHSEGQINARYNFSAIG